MHITDVEAIPVWAAFSDAFEGDVPPELAFPAFGMRRTPLGGQGAAVVKITTEDGLVGIGESMGRPGPRGSAAYIDEVLKPMLVGHDSRQIALHWSSMMEEIRFAPMCVSGVDMALWDLMGKRYGDSLTHLMGGPFRGSIDCYASPIPFLPTPDESAAQASRFVNQGFQAIKLKIGRGVERDLEHVAAVRSAIGSRIKLLVDANGAYTVSESIRLAQRLVRESVFWLEEPVHPEYADDLARVRRRVDLPIASGEWLGSVYQFRDLIKAEAADVIMPNITRCGGITGFLRIAEMAELENVMVAPHGVGLGIGITASIHACGSISNFLIYEYNQLFNPLRHTVMEEAIQFRDGQLYAPSGDGLGITLNQNTVQQYDLRHHRDGGQ